MGSTSLDRSMQELSRDVSFLGRVLGDVLREQGGEELFAAVEGLRRACRDRRHRGSGDFSDIRRAIDELPLERALDVVRAFTVYFHLINMAEETHRLRRIAQRESELWPEPRDESIGAAIAALSESGASAEEAHQLLSGLSIRPVFTAHPTEARRMTLLGHLRRISKLVGDLTDELTPKAKERLIALLYAEVTNFWQTNELRGRRQSVLDEVHNGLFYLETSVFDVTGRLYRDLDDALFRHYPELAGRFYPFLSFGSWIGGDRDGNPNVTAEITDETLRLHHRAALELYSQRIARLIDQITSSASLTGVSKELADSVDADAEAFGVQGETFLQRRGDEPYRQKLTFMLERLRNDLEDREGPAYASADGFIDDLCLIQRSLAANKGERVAHGPLQDLVCQARVFRFHLATLDVRQHRDRHLAAIDEIIKTSTGRSYSELSESEKIPLLQAAIENVTRPPEKVSRETWEVIKVFQLIAEAQARMGREALNTYIVSFTQSASDLLAILYFARLAGLFDPDQGRSNLQIVPLFETEDDLDRAGGIMEALWKLPLYRAHLEAWENRQEIMIGYSDSDKDAGYVTSSWMLCRAQQELTKLGARHGVQLTFFHGRGGAIGRGGGPLQRAIAGQPPGTVNGRIKVTEQGEVLFTRYANPGIAHRHLEQVTHAVIQASRDVPLEPDAGVPPASLPVHQSYRHLMQFLSDRALSAYRDLVSEPHFLKFFEEATPLRSIIRLRIASRPASRREGPLQLEDLRAIPWVFAWTQARWGVPGWYGLGSALQAAAEEGQAEVLTRMYREWSFFRWLIDAAQISLGKADLGVALEYARLEPDPSLRERYTARLRDEHSRTIAGVNRTVGQDRLLDSWPTLQRSIELRNPYVDPISLIQVRAIREVRETMSDELADLLRQIIDRSVTGVAAGLQNTG